MLSEEKKAIKYFYNLRSTIDESYMLFDEEINVKCGKETIKQITLVLNLITKLQKENKQKDKIIEKKDKIIYEMLGSFADIGFGFDYCNNDDRCINDCDKCLMQYFERKAKDGRN